MRVPGRPSLSLLLLAAAGGRSVLAASDADKPTMTVTACTAVSTSGAFYDLRPAVAIPLPKDGTKLKKGVPTVDYHARGYDLGYNFTLNICGAVLDSVTDVIGVDKALWRNVSAWYESDGDVFSLGQQSATLTPRGRKLVLQYSDGSPCGPDADKWYRRSTGSRVHDGAQYKHYDDEDEALSTGAITSASASTSSSAIATSPANKDKPGQRKSATISFLCDADALNNQAAASFVGASPDECAYFFEVRSHHACAGVEPHAPGTVGPGGVFAIIFFIAVLVYVLGGIFYQRTVAHARGWRQLPNYTLWAGIWNFFSDFFIIIASSCGRLLPSRRGYRTVSGSPTGRSRNREDENRLIDQLDEEWED